MKWPVASTLHTTSEHGVSSITTADAHTSAASIRLNWCPRRFKWTRPFRRKTKSGFYECAITFQLASTTYYIIQNLGILSTQCKQVLATAFKIKKDHSPKPGVHRFYQKSRSHLKILGTRRVTRRNFQAHTQTSDITIKKFRCQVDMVPVICSPPPWIQLTDRCVCGGWVGGGG